MNSRRKLLFALGLSACSISSPAIGQLPPSPRRIGVLMAFTRPVPVDSHFLGGLVKGLRELGYFEGQNITIEWRFADGNYERLPALAAELEALKPELIVGASTPVVEAIRKATNTIPVVMLSVGDPVASGFVTSLGRPGGNITGLSTLTQDTSPKLLEALKAQIPKLSRIAVLTNPANSNSAASRKNIDAAAQQLRVRTTHFEARTPDEIEGAFAAMARQRHAAVIVPADSMFTQQARRIADLAIQYKLSSAFTARQYVQAGGLLSYGPNLPDMFRRAATYVDKILKGTKPADLPVQQPTKFELVVNGKTANSLGLKISRELLLRADEVIE